MALVADIEKMVAQGRFDRQFLLVGEHWRSVRHLWLDQAEPLRAARLGHDLRPGVWSDAGLPGLANIRPKRDDRFEFAEDGRPAIIIPAYDTIPGIIHTNPARHVEHLTDLIAVDLDHPDRFWRRRGEALILGNAYLEIAGETCAPVPVYRNPMTWLRAAGAGVVVLDWDWARELLLDRELIAEDVELGNRLEAALKPDIWVMGVAA